MKLIIGGAFQGKTRFAAETFFEGKHLPEAEIFDLSCGEPEEGMVSDIKIFIHLEAMTGRFWREGRDFKEYLELFGDSVVICRDISDGIVPMDGDERAYREYHGSLLQKLAAASDEVYRVFCGIGMKLK